MLTAIQCTMLDMLDNEHGMHAVPAMYKALACNVHADAGLRVSGPVVQSWARARATALASSSYSTSCACLVADASTRASLKAWLQLAPPCCTIPPPSGCATPAMFTLLSRAKAPAQHLCPALRSTAITVQTMYIMHRQCSTSFCLPWSGMSTEHAADCSSRLYTNRANAAKRSTHDCILLHMPSACALYTGMHMIRSGLRRKPHLLQPVYEDTAAPDTTAHACHLLGVPVPVQSAAQSAVHYFIMACSLPAPKTSTW
jgi:hypothetical protein